MLKEKAQKSLKGSDGPEWNTTGSTKQGLPQLFSQQEASDGFVAWGPVKVKRKEREGPAEKVSDKRAYSLFCSLDTYTQACLQIHSTNSNLSDLNDSHVLSEQWEAFRRKPTYMLFDFQWEVLVYFILLIFNKLSEGVMLILSCV